MGVFWWWWPEFSDKSVRKFAKYIKENLKATIIRVPNTGIGLLTLLECGRPHGKNIGNPDGTIMELLHDSCRKAKTTELEALKAAGMAEAEVEYNDITYKFSDKGTGSFHVPFSLQGVGVDVEAWCKSSTETTCTLKGIKSRKVDRKELRKIMRPRSDPKESDLKLDGLKTAGIEHFAIVNTIYYATSVTLTFKKSWDHGGDAKAFVEQLEKDNVHINLKASLKGENIISMTTPEGSKCKVFAVRVLPIRAILDTDDETVADCFVDVPGAADAGMMMSSFETADNHAKKFGEDDLQELLDEGFGEHLEALMKVADSDEGAVVTIDEPGEGREVAPESAPAPAAPDQAAAAAAAPAVGANPAAATSTNVMSSIGAYRFETTVTTTVQDQKTKWSDTTLREAVKAERVIKIKDLQHAVDLLFGKETRSYLTQTDATNFVIFAKMFQFGEDSSIIIERGSWNVSLGSGDNFANISINEDNSLVELIMVALTLGAVVYIVNCYTAAQGARVATAALP